MKKSFLLLFFFVFSAISFAQKTKLGIAVGTNYTTYKSSFTYNDNKFKLGFLVGIDFEHKLSDYISLKSGIYYERRNRTIKINELLLPDGSNDNTSYKTTENNNNIDLPILLKFHIGQSKSFFIDSGFTINFLRSTTILGSTAPLYRQTDLNFSIGTGTYFKIFKANDLNLEIRYSPHLVNLSKNENYYKLKMTPLNFIVTYDLNL